MTETEVREKPYVFPTQHEHVSGQLTLGWKTFPVAVNGYSWAGYTIEVNDKLAKKLRRGRTGKLFHQGSSYEIRCLSRERIAKDRIQVELEREDDEATRKRLIRRTRTSAPATIALNQRDPVLSFATALFFIMLLMMLPGWGESFGTTHYFSDGFRAIFVSVCDGVKCLGG